MLMGFEGQVLRGTAGSTAATLMENLADVSLDYDIEEGSTTVRGDGSVPPIDYTAVTIRKWSCQFTFLNNTGDASLEACRVAAANGTPIALRMKDRAAGKGYDGDVNIKYSHAKPLRGEQTLQFTATPNNSLRAANLYT